MQHRVSFNNSIYDPLLSKDNLQTHFILQSPLTPLPYTCRHVYYTAVCRNVLKGQSHHQNENIFKNSLFVVGFYDVIL